MSLNENTQVDLASLYNQTMTLEREDYAAPAGALSVAVMDDQRFRLQSTSATEPGPSFPLTAHATDQLADRLSKGLRSYSNEMVERGFHDIVAQNLNELLERTGDDKKFQVRTIQPNGERLARAVVSDAYKPIDDILLLPSIIEQVDGRGNWQSLGGQITDTHTRVRFLNREPILTNYGPNNREIKIGFQFANSEVGRSKTRFDLFLWDGFCLNGCVFGKVALASVDYTHRGSRIETSFGLISEERIRQAELASIQATIIEATRNVLDQNHAKAIVDKIDAANARKLQGERPEAVRLIAQQVGLTKKQSDNVLAHWMSNEDNAFGVSNAITRLAQDADNYETRVSLEAAGGAVLDLTKQQWASVMALAS